MANPIKKISKLQFKADKAKSKAEMLKKMNKHKKAGKFEGRSSHYEHKIAKLRLKYNIPEERESQETSFKEREIITKEIVKVPCQHCGTLNLNTDHRCSGCGGSVK